MNTEHPAEPEPKYYRAFVNDELIDVIDLQEHDGYAHALTELEVDPYDTGEGWADEDAARAHVGELILWGKAYETLTDDVQRAHDELEAARAVWEAAQGKHTAALKDAWQKYAPTDAAIVERIKEVREMRHQRKLEKAATQERAKQEAQAREDAELGPRTWVIHQPERDVYGKSRPDMMVPTIHLAGCTVTKSREDYPRERAYQYARQAQVQKTLLKGAPRYERGRATKDTLPTKLCGRCKPQESLAQALGAVYEAWQDEQDSQRQPMPRIKAVPAVLKLTDEWGNGREPGYRVMSDKYYRQEGLLEDDEIMLGWYDPARETIVPNVPALERLVAILPGRGFTARRIKEPQAYHVGDKISETGVAVRRMTKLEIRRRQEAAAPPADVQNLDD